jgi:hypothetical protein
MASMNNHLKQLKIKALLFRQLSFEEFIFTLDTKTEK